MQEDVPQSKQGSRDADLGRRSALRWIALGGVGAVFGRAVLAQAESAPVTDAMIRQAAWIAGIEFTPEERKLMLEGVSDLVGQFAELRKIELDNSVAPALQFRPEGERNHPGEVAVASAVPQRAAAATGGGADRGADADVAFSSIRELHALLQAGKISAVELSGIYQERMRRLGPQLECVIDETAELALKQARLADSARASGQATGPLSGIPWGAKDLLSVPGYRTTWGARPFETQRRPEVATVAARLEDAGAVLLAKLTLGALAWGDVWYGGKTRNPWDLEQGSSGSSAGSAAASAAALVGFSIGSETWGSIVSPCTRCGATGLRPTFGRVSRHGAMALSWSMDKLGPIGRSVEDCAAVFAAIQGPDGLDRSVVDRPFAWPPRGDSRKLRVGFAEELFAEDRTAGIEDEDARRRAAAWQEYDRETLATLERLGYELRPFRLPKRYPVGALSFILTAEAAAAFDDLSRSGRDDQLVRQVEQAWPNVFRQGQMIPAVEYIRANRIRTLVLQELELALDDLDVYVAPSFGGDNLLLNNLTGHPCVVVPNGIDSAGHPTSVTFVGRLHGESAMLAVAHDYQEATNFHRQRPPFAAA